MILARNKALKLYRDLLRYGQQLTYTDKPFYYKYIREQFEKYKTITDKDQIKEESTKRKMM